MRLVSLSCRNIKGWDKDFHLSPIGDVVLVMGRNGENKTSVLALVTGLFGKATTRMLRPGASEGEIRAVIEDDGETLEIVRTFTPEKVKTPVVKSSTQGKIGAAAEYIKGIIDAVSIEPIGQAMNATEERQREILLETIKFDLDHDKLGSAVSEVVGVPNLSAVLQNAKKLPALDAIKVVEDLIYAARRDYNRDAKRERIHAEELRLTVTKAPEGEAEDWSTVALNLSEQLEALAAEEQKLKRDADQIAATDLREVESIATEEIAGIRGDYAEKIAALEKERDGKIEERRAILVGDQTTLREYLNNELQEIEEKIRPQRESLKEQRATAMTKAADQEQDYRSLQIAANADRSADQAEKKSDAITSSLKALEELRIGLLDSIPPEMKGLQFKDGVPWLDGTPLSEVNTEKRARFWAKVGALRAGDLGIVCFDGAECMDADHFKSFIKGAKATGLQWFVARVDDEPFRIEQL